MFHLYKAYVELMKGLKFSSMIIMLFFFINFEISS